MRNNFVRLSIFLVLGITIASILQLRSEGNPLQEEAAIQGITQNSELLLVRKGGQYGYIDKSGKMVIKPEFTSAGPFSQGLASVQIGTKKGYIDQTGRLVVQPQFDEAREFSDGMAAVRINGQYGYIDKSGNMVIKPEFNENAQPFSGGIAQVLVREGSITGPVLKIGYIDTSGKYVWKPTN